MHHYFEAITNNKGDALTGYYVRLLDQTSGDPVTLYADLSLTPIISVSEVADAAKVDADGNVDIYVDVGTYDLAIYATDSTTLVRIVRDVGMNVDMDTAAEAVAAQEAAEAAAAEAAESAGEAEISAATALAVLSSTAVINNATAHAATRAVLAALNTTLGPAYLAEADHEGMFVWDSSNLASNVTLDPDQLIYVAPTGAPTGASGAWVRANADDPLQLPYSASGVIDIRLGLGQSNRLGTAATTPGVPAVVDPRGQVWNPTTNTFGPLTAYPVSSGGATSTGGDVPAFCNQYCLMTGRELAHLESGKDSQSLAQWQKGHASNNYTNMLAEFLAAQAVLVAQGYTIGKIFVDWWQGEAESSLLLALNTTPVAYYTAMGTLWTDLKADTGAELLVITTVGTYTDSSVRHAPAIQRAQQKFARDNEDVIIGYDYVGGFGQDNGLKSDAVHLNQVGYNIVGFEKAKRTVAALFETSGGRMSDQQINRYGRLAINRTQRWNVHSGILSKDAAGLGWTVNYSLPKTSSMIDHIDATADAYRLDVYTSCYATTIMSLMATFAGTLQNLGVRIGVGSPGLTVASGGWQNGDVDGYSRIPIYFYVDMHLRANMTTQVIDNASMGGLGLGGITATWAVGQVTVSHPTILGLGQAASQGGVGKQIRVNPGSVSTIVTTKDAAGAAINDTVSIFLPNMALPHASIPNTAEMSLLAIAAEYETS